MKQKLISLILALALLLAPISAFATDAPNTEYTVRVYDYTAQTAGWANAQGVVLDTTVTGEVGKTGTEVLKAALDAAEIPYVIESTEYGNYLASLGGLSEMQFGKLSGWLCAIDGDQFNNMGLDTALSENATLEVHYSVTGGEDVGATWGSLPILTKLTLGGVTAILSKETDYTTYTTSYWIEVGGEKTALSGSGTEADPFEIELDLPRGTNKGDLQLVWSASLDPAYATLEGEDITDYSSPVTLCLLCETGGETYYTVSVSVPVPSSGGGGGGGGGGKISSVPEPEPQKPTDVSVLVKDGKLSFGNEWAVIALARSGYALPQSDWDAYYASVAETVRKEQGVLSTRKYTEYSRTVLALTALGADPTNIAGYDLVAPLYDVDAVVKQGVNGAIWALLALDSANDTVDRTAYLNEIITNQNADGGWSLSGETSDPDLTAMAVTALAKHADKSVLDAAVQYLTALEATTCESAAQILIAFSALGQNRKELREQVLSYQTADGFSHTKGCETNAMATEQAVLALVAADRADAKKSALYDMGDAERKVSLFYDVIGHPNHAAIESLGKMGLVNGRPNGAFDPNATMIRAEFCALITRALDLTSTAERGFPDVKAGDWYYASVCAAVNAGIVKGRANGNFDPAALITFEEAAVMVSRAAKLLGVSADPSEHAPVSSAWAQEDVSFCHAAGLFENLSFDAPRAILRCEIAEMVYHLIEEKPHA